MAVVDSWSMLLDGVQVGTQTAVLYDDGMMTVAGIASRFRPIGLTLILATLATSCDPYITLPSHAIGMFQTETGQTSTMYVYCPAESLTRVQLLLAKDQDEPPGVREGRLLWEIKARSDSGLRPATLVIGDAPPGFDTTVELLSPLLPGRRYAIFMDSTMQGIGRGVFRLDDLRPDKVFSGGRYFSRNAFPEYGSAKCDT